MTILEERHPYGNEFFGGQSSLVVTPITERCFLTMAMVRYIYQYYLYKGFYGDKINQCILLFAQQYSTDNVFSIPYLTVWEKVP